ncbi:MAG: NUDIX domain-containing protein [Candidatus Heimdallarchaeaceae archaeon]
MSLDMYKERNPLPVVLIALFNKNKILLAKRKREPYKGFYGILGGRQTFGMLTKDIVKKEVLEETGFSVKEGSIEIRGLYSEILLDKNNNPKDHFIFRVCKAEIDKKISDEIEGTDIEKFKWFNLPLSEDVKRKIIPTDLIMLEHILSNKKYDFKEFVMQETENPNELKIVYIK